jgi:hypothetical protein
MAAFANVEVVMLSLYVRCVRDAVNDPLSPCPRLWAPFYVLRRWRFVSSLFGKSEKFSDLNNANLAFAAIRRARKSFRGVNRHPVGADP